MRAFPTRALAILTCLATGIGGAQSFPDRALIGYWHNWGGTAALPLASVPSSYDVVNVSFAVPASPAGADMTFQPDPGLYPDPQDFLREVRALQSQGKRVQISIGGAAHPVHVDSPAAAATFVNSMRSIINTWGFDGLDVDLEGTSLWLQAGDADFMAPSSPRIVHFINAVQALLGGLPSSFALTAAPETAFVQGGYSAYGGIWGAYLPVIHALRTELDCVHVQHYNTGTMFDRNGQLRNPGTTDFHVAMADMLLAGFRVAGGQSFPALRADQVAIGLPASPQAAGSGFTSAPAVHDALDQLFLGRPFGGNYSLAEANGHPAFRGLMTWSINWDAVANEGFSRPHRAYLDSIFLGVNAPTASTTTGGAFHFSLRAGRGHAGRTYLLAPSVTGMSPGVPLGSGVVLPLVPDALTSFALMPSSAPYFGSLTGTLDPQGEAATTWIVPPLPGVTTPLYAAFLLAPPGPPFASHALTLSLAP